MTQSTDKTSSSLYSGIGSLWNPGDLSQGGSVDPSGPSFYPNGTIDLKGEDGEKGEQGPQGEQGPAGEGLDPQTIERIDTLELKASQAAASFLEEVRLRIAGDSAEAASREQLAVSIKSDLGAAVDAKVETAVQAVVDEQRALSERLESAVANFVTPATATSIATTVANAQVSEQARATAEALAAESTARSQLAASLRSETLSAIAGAISDERAVRVNAEQVITSRLSSTEASLAGALNANACFQASGYAGGVPAGWSEWSNGWQATVSPEPGRNGTQPVHLRREGNTNIGFIQLVYNVPAGWYVVEADVQMFSGNWQGSGIYIDFGEGGAYRLGFGGTPDIDEFVFSGAAYNRRSWSVLVYNSRQTTASLHLMGGWDGFGFDGSSNDTHWHKCLLRPATDGEIKGRKALQAAGDALAKASIAQEASVNASTRLANARVEFIAQTPGGRARMTLKSDTNGGAGIDLEGDVRIYGDLTVDGSMRTEKLAQQAVTNVIIAADGAHQFINTSGDFRSNGATITSTGGVIRIDYSVAFSKGSTGGIAWTRLERVMDGVVTAFSASMYNAVQAGAGGQFSGFVIDQIPPGKTARYCMYYLWNQGAGSVTWNYEQVLITELKR